MKQTFKQSLIEAVLIIFSVLFALLINKWHSNSQLAEQKDIALSSIKKEIAQNKKVIGYWQSKHLPFKEKINAIVEGKNDSLKNELRKYKYLNFAVLIENGTIVDALLANTAWESAKATGILSEFDFDMTRKLTEVYTMQDIIMNKTIDNIVQLYFDPSSHDMTNLESTLIQLQLRLLELTGQEALMDQFYEQALEILSDIE